MDVYITEYLSVDIKLVVEKLLTIFREEDVRYALIGGLALGAWGVPRATIDIDFLVLHTDLDTIHRIMTGLGYDCRYRTENVSQYVSQLKIFGEVDFLHAFRHIAVAMLERAEDKKIFNETITIKVLKVEDLIGLKVVTTEGVELGKVDHLMETGANDVLVVNGERERLIPFLQPQTVTRVDLDGGLLVVEWDPDF